MWVIHKLCSFTEFTDFLLALIHFLFYPDQSNLAKNMHINNSSFILAIFGIYFCYKYYIFFDYNLLLEPLT